MAEEAIADAFEYSDHSDWRADNPDGDLQDDTKETLETSKLEVEEALDEIPKRMRPRFRTHTQNITVSARAIADRNTFGHPLPAGKAKHRREGS